MTVVIEAITAWFTSARRQAIYAVVAALAPILVYSSVIAEGQVETVLTIATVVIQAFGGLLALLNLKVRDVASWFITGGRAAIYAGAAIVAPAAADLGWITTDQSESFLTAASLALTALASILAVITLTPTPEVAIAPETGRTPDDPV